MAPNSDDVFEQWLNAMPEGKLELIDGQLLISSLAGSRRIAWNLLDDYGPAIGLAHAPLQLWWSALTQAFQPNPRPATPNAWWRWAESFHHKPEPPPAGPHLTGEHRRTYEVLKSGLNFFGGVTGLGFSMGRDFVVRLGENGLTPDQVFIDRPRLPHLHSLYLHGPPAVVIEVTQPGSEDQDRLVKRLLCERAGVFEYWLFDPFAREALFLRLDGDGRYQQVLPDAEGIFHSDAVLGLALSLPDLWDMTDTDWDHRWRPFLPCDVCHPDPLPSLGRRENELGWDTVPFVPRVALEPCPITFEEFASWCGRAKFESSGWGLTIGGSEATRRVFGMLLMTFGLVEIVKLAHPRDWITFLAPEVHQPLVDQHAATLRQRAVYTTRDGMRTDTIHCGKVPGISEVSAYEESEQECRDELAKEVRTWVLLRLARGEEIPTLDGKDD